MIDNNLGNRAEKAVDIASTYVEVLIGLASGLITALLGIYAFLVPIPNINFLFLKISLIFFGISIIGGLFGLGGLVNATAGSSPIPTNARSVRGFVLVELVAFGIGIILLILVFP